MRSEDEEFGRSSGMGKLRIFWRRAWNIFFSESVELLASESLGRDC